MKTKTREFGRLLQDCHIRATYLDVSGRRQRAPRDALLALVQALGIELNDPDEAGERLRQRRHARLSRGLEPVHVAWGGFTRAVHLSLPAAEQPTSISYRLDLSSNVVEKSFAADDLPIAKWADDESDEFLQYKLPLPRKLPFGYHELHVAAGARIFESLIISAPRTAYRHEDRSRSWGCFLPLYALRTEKDWGVGDFSSLGEFSSWISSMGGSDAGTLPLLAAFLDEPFEISPYRPASRLFWNELYVDITAIPELQSLAETRQLIEADAFRSRISAQRESKLVDYREVMKLKREAIERLSCEFFENRSARFGEFQEFLELHPETIDYAKFRAACEGQRATWPNWPGHMADGKLNDSDYEQNSANYHMYAQWIAHEQLSRIRQATGSPECGLYLDLPIGVDPAGYDTWRYQSEYVAGASVGSPPDIVFPKGQDWGLPPMHPDRMRESGYELFRRVMSNNMKFAHRLRIDHVLAFHRLYCIPPGFDAAHGAYIEYPFDELYAIAVLESHLNRCELIGENLGTVPEKVDQQLKSHAIGGMWVAPYELEPGRRTGLNPPTANDAAMLNTHDMPPLAAWWRAEDIDERVALELIGAEAAESERKHRATAAEQLRQWLQQVAAQWKDDASYAETDAVPLRPLLRAIAASDARFVLINLEDLWLERCPQNVPGVCDARPNWQRKAKYRLDKIKNMAEVVDALSEVDAIRNEITEEQFS